MLNYIIRRLFYAIPILIGVNLITFTLFFVVNTPDDMARMQLGIKRVTPEAIARWKQERGYDKPLMFNNAEQGVDKLTRTVFFEKSIAMFAFRFGRADDGRDIAHEIKKRMMPSLSIALPVFLAGTGRLHRVRVDDGVLSGDLRGFLGSGAMRRANVHLQFVLHHRRAVPDKQTMASRAHIRLWRRD